MLKTGRVCLRIHYRLRGDGGGFFHTFRTTGVRLFNNIIIHINNDEEARGQSLCVTSCVAVNERP